MKKIGILGGTFDPVHFGHISLAMDAKEQVGLDKVIFMPANLQPFKLDKQVTPCEKRIEMLELAIEGIEGFEVSTLEMDNQGISYTYLTMDHVRSQYDKEDEVYFICGTDSFLKISTWKKAEELLTQNPVIVGARPGYKDESLNEEIQRIESTYGTKVIKINNKKLDISSTDARERIHDGDSVEQLVNDKVKGYIEKNGLY